MFLATTEGKCNTSSLDLVLGFTFGRYVFVSNSKKYDLGNKQKNDTDCRQLDCKLCDLIYFISSVHIL